VRNIKQILAPKYVVLLAVVLVLGWFMATVISSFSGISSGAIIDYLHYFTVEARLNSSDSVVHAIYIGEEEYSRPITKLVTDKVVGQNYTVLREYKILEAFVGGGEVGETIYVDSAYELLRAGPEGDDVSGSETVTRTIGDAYVLFLNTHPASEDDPPKIGDTHRRQSGQPHIAQLVDGKLRFLADSIYLEAVGARNEQPAVPGSAAPFTMTIDELRELKNRPAPVDTAPTVIADGE
jgi:hypothetical protein